MAVEAGDGEGRGGGGIALFRPKQTRKIRIIPHNWNPTLNSPILEHCFFSSPSFPVKHISTTMAAATRGFSGETKQWRKAAVSVNCVDDGDGKWWRRLQRDPQAMAAVTGGAHAQQRRSHAGDDLRRQQSSALADRSNSPSRLLCVFSATNSRLRQPPPTSAAYNRRLSLSRLYLSPDRLPLRTRCQEHCCDI